MTDRSQDSQLFSTEAFEIPEEPKHEILELFDKEPGFFTGGYPYISISVDLNVPAFSPDREHDDKSAEYRSVDYGDPMNGLIFPTWSKTPIYDRQHHGYFAGFPRIMEQDGTYQDCLHFWYNNSDIAAGNFAVPLTAVQTIFVHDDTRTNIESHMDEMAMDGEDSRRYTIPLIHDTKTGETITRPATEEDLQAIIKDCFNVPTLVYGEAKGWEFNAMKYGLPLVEVTQLLDE